MACLPEPIGGIHRIEGKLENNKKDYIGLDGINWLVMYAIILFNPFDWLGLKLSVQSTYAGYLVGLIGWETILPIQFIVLFVRGSSPPNNSI